MHTSLANLLRAVALVLCAAAVPAQAADAPYPARMVKLVAPFPPEAKPAFGAKNPTVLYPQ